MRVVILTPHGYGRGGEFWAQGKVADLPERLAVKLIGYGIAAAAPEPPKAAPKVETASAAPAENAAKRVTKPAPSKPPKR